MFTCVENIRNLDISKLDMSDHRDLNIITKYICNMLTDIFLNASYSDDAFEARTIRNNILLKGLINSNVKFLNEFINRYIEFEDTDYKENILDSRYIPYNVWHDKLMLIRELLREKS